MSDQFTGRSIIKVDGGGKRCPRNASLLFERLKVILVLMINDVEIKQGIGSLRCFKYANAI